MTEHDELDLPLGRMVRTAAQFELRLELVVKQLCESPFGALLLSGESSSRLLNACRTLLEAHDEIPPTPREELQSILREGKALLDRRHRYVHGAAGIVGETGELLSMRFRRMKAEPEFSKRSSDDLTELADAFDELTDRATKWMLACVAGFVSS
ncbi:hypothetical protein [Streptomyces sp. NBC_00286]|uniref:hypothetical protein n=1 Tax=Streptomyces sp. NBC_00286 TaxID=2975701 RepID=UPI002E2A2585|nr:hypothetical protein [Streptomyces sp. NBC_00286]